MKILKRILIALVVILVIAGIGIYFLPNHYTVSTTVEINKPVDVVYAQVADFTKWNNWSPYKEADPAAKGTFEGMAATPGQKMSWDGEKSGMGSLTTKSAMPNQSINNDLEITKPFQMKAKDIWKFETSGTTTKVTWISEGGLKYPFGRLFGLSVDKTLGGEQKHGLDNLKKFAEGLPVESAPVASADTTSVKSM